MSVRNPSALSLVDVLANGSSDIRAHIASVVSSYGAPPLYPRQWVYISQETISLKPKFRVMQFNILAEGLSAHPENTPPFLEDVDGSPIKPSDCGGFDHDQSTGELVFNFHQYRKWRVLEEILRVDPDVLALEEIDHFADFFEPVLSTLGYKGIFQPKKKSPSTQFGYYSDGVAVFWKEAVFSDDDDSARCANDLSPFIAVPLLHRDSLTKVVFAATHLKSKPSAENETRRESQITAGLAMAQDCMEEIGGVSLVLLGDFNTDAFSVPGVQARAIPFVTAWRDGCLRSAHPLPTDSSSELYSTWKSRSGRVSKHLIDYVFLTHRSLAVTGVLAPPEDLDTSDQTLPNLRYPSDHISLAVDIGII